MQSLSYSLLKPAAEDALDSARYSPRRLVLIHTAVAMAIGLVLSVLSYVLDLGIAQTGGLDGIGNRTILQSIQSVLSLLSLVLMPFWEIGFINAALRFARRQDAGTNSLFAGFKHWGVVLRGMLLKGLILMAVMFAGGQLASTIYMMTPAAAPLHALALELAESGADYSALLENEAYLELMMESVPFVLIGMLLLAIPALYLLRFADYVMMDQPELGAVYAIFSSFATTKRHFKALVKLDVHFWWYYLLELVTVVVSYGHLLLELMGIDIGIGDDTAMFVFYIASLLTQLGLYVWKRHAVFTTYALAYDIIYLPSVPLQKNQENE